MTHLNIKNLHASYGDKVILHNINLAVAQGEMIALLGPSGCGKTTLLNALCGFMPIQKGDIYIGDRRLSKLAAEKRNITMVFQSYALWPHMTVAQNIGYGLKIQKVNKPEIQARVNELLSIVNLDGLQDEQVTALSGGQRQRVALARALAIRPDVLVLDEPLSNLDAKVRLNVRHEIKALQKKLGFTSLIVTHDQEEALVMADRIAVLNKGQIEQIGTPEEIYHKPKTAFVADFMGANNKLTFSSLEELQQQVSFSSLTQPKAQLSSNNKRAPYRLFFRSENVSLTTHSQNHPQSDSETNTLRILGDVQQSAFLGGSYQISVHCGKHTIQADHHENLLEDTPVTLCVPADALHIF
ncbi:ABC transporter ATP-binding protein [Marinomonas algicola]|uniref:ABC transporter ATP-binding protein n=1 Tax=Marinomonas algicola TaxID=2773454 RepID=UPI00174B1712|nr:ABC transporter ATP-binding protein [Marinomonas algicola]